MSERLEEIEEGIVMTPTSPLFLIESARWLVAEVKRLRNALREGACRRNPPNSAEIRGFADNRGKRIPDE